MSHRSKIEEVQFYLDRSQDSLLATLRSILTNPRISDDERLQALRMMSAHHQEVFEFIAARIFDGERRGLEMAAAHGNRQQGDIPQ